MLMKVAPLVSVMPSTFTPATYCNLSPATFCTRLLAAFSLGHPFQTLIALSGVRWGRGRIPDLPSREPSSNPLCYRYEMWALSFSPRYPSSLICVNEYLAIDIGGNVS